MKPIKPAYVVALVLTAFVCGFFAKTVAEETSGCFREGKSRVDSFAWYYRHYRNLPLRHKHTRIESAKYAWERYQNEYGPGYRHLAKHRVRSGDTVESIARKYDSFPDAILNENRQLVGNPILKAGTVLRVPHDFHSGYVWGLFAPEMQEELHPELAKADSEHPSSAKSERLAE